MRPFCEGGLNHRACNLLDNSFVVCRMFAPLVNISWLVVECRKYQDLHEVIFREIYEYEGSEGIRSASRRYLWKLSNFPAITQRWIDISFSGIGESSTPHRGRISSHKCTILHHCILPFFIIVYLAFLNFCRACLTFLTQIELLIGKIHFAGSIVR